MATGQARKLSDLERNQIVAVLNEVDWDSERAASELGISKQTLYNRMRKYGIERRNGKSTAKLKLGQLVPVGGIISTIREPITDSGAKHLLPRGIAYLRCETCPYGGQETIDWTLNKRRCPAFMMDPEGYCLYQIEQMPLPLDWTPHSWAEAMRSILVRLHDHHSLDLEIRQRLGVGKTEGALRGLQNLAQLIFEFMAHCDRMGLLKEPKAGDKNAGAGLARLVRSLLRNPQAKDKFIDDFANAVPDPQDPEKTSAKRKAMMEQVFELIAQIEPAAVKRDADAEVISHARMDADEQFEV